MLDILWITKKLVDNFGPSEKLVALGYENIVEFGGIIDWTRGIEIVKLSLVYKYCDSFSPNTPILSNVIALHKKSANLPNFLQKILNIK